MKSAIIIITGIIFILLSTSAHAVAFGASPATLTFDIGKGDSLEKIVSVSTNSLTYVGVSYSISDEIKDLITVSPTSGLKTKIDEPLEITVTAKSSLFEELGSHMGTITFTTTPTENTAGGTGSAIATGVAVKVTVNIGTVKAVKTAAASGTKSISSGLMLAIATIVLLILAAAMFLTRPKKKSKKK
jgi:uncharacterized membrane protein